jgi:arylsulfatase A-like enzyme
MGKQAIALTLICTCLSTSLWGQNKPNVLFIAIDDLRNFVNCFGYHQAITPNMDQLAKKSVVFTNAHNQAPMCGPSRSSVMTGIQPYRSGAYGFVDWREVPKCFESSTLPGHFIENGYQTLCGGKIFHGNSLRPSDWSDIYCKAQHKGGTWGTKSLKEADYALKRYWGMKVNGPSDLPESKFHDTMTANLAVKQLKRSHHKPFFLAVGFTKPHLPWIAPRKYFDMYDADSLELPVTLEDDIEDTPEAAQFLAYRIHDMGVRNEKGGARRMLHAYLATITYMDAQLGKVLDALEASPYNDQTAIVLWSDHGWHLGEKQAWSKFTLWDESTRNPLMISLPGQQHNATCDEPVQLVDIYPTLVELCGLPSPDHQLDGNSLVPLLHKPKLPWPHPAMTCNGRDSFSLNFKDFKYNHFFDGSEELCDNLKDPLHHTNLADQPEYATIKAKLKAHLPKKELRHPNVSDNHEWMLWLTDHPPLDAWRNEMKEIEACFEKSGRVKTEVFRRHSRVAVGQKENR